MLHAKVRQYDLFGFDRVLEQTRVEWIHPVLQQDHYGPSLLHDLSYDSMDLQFPLIRPLQRLHVQYFVAIQQFVVGVHGCTPHENVHLRGEGGFVVF